MKIEFKPHELSQKNDDLKAFLEHYSLPLKTSESLYHVITDTKGNYIYTNPYFQKKYAHLADDFIGFPSEKTYYVDDHQKCIQTIIKCNTQPDISHTVILRKLNKDNQLIWTQWEFRILHFNEQIIGYDCIGYDVSQAQHHDIAQQELKVLLDQTCNLGKIGSWTYDVVNDINTWSEYTYQIHEEPLDMIPNPSKGVLYYKEGKARETIIDVFTKCIQKAEPFDVQLEFISANGNKKWVRSIGRPFLENGKVVRIEGVIQDLSHKKEEQRELILLKSTVSNAKDAILITEAEPFDEPGPKILYVNEAFCKMTGYSREEVIGCTPRILQGPLTDPNTIMEIGKKLRNWETVNVEILNYKKNGETFWLDMSIVPVADEKGWFTHWIAIERDVTERKKLDIEKELLISELVKSNKELKHFAYINSHNLRAPLSNITGLMSYLNEDEIENEAQKEIIMGMKLSVDQLNQTIEDLNEILSIKSSNKAAVEKINIPEKFSIVKSQLQLLLDEINPEIVEDFSQFESVNFRKQFLESILLNLLTNSIKYRKPDKRLKIHIYTEIDPNGNKKLVFKDNGIGLDVSRYKDRMFGLYQRFHKNEDGKGIGLYLVKAQVEAMGGIIDAEGAPNKGLTFKITFN